MSSSSSYHHSYSLLIPSNRSDPICRTFFLRVSLVAIAVFFTSFLAFYFTPLYHLSVCSGAGDPKSCLAIISKELIPAGAARRPTTRVDLLKILVQRSITGVKTASKTARLVKRKINDPRQAQSAVADCVELMDLAEYDLHETAMALSSPLTSSSLADVHTQLSAVLTSHVTCMDGLQGGAKLAMDSTIDHLMTLSSTSLAVASSLTSQFDGSPAHIEKYPSWLGARDGKLLKANIGDEELCINVTVAKDGSGDYTTIQEAVDSAPDRKKNRYVIYVKRGLYEEKVVVGKAKRNVMLIGDGMEETVISGSLNVVDGSTTFNSATVVVEREGFIAQDIGFENTAGPEKHQAVALRVGGDKSVINRCKIDAYQDTLYAHKSRQFYQSSIIAGTIDFIFGNAAVVFQNCTLTAKKPMPRQANMVTAQGRTDPNQNTGTSIQNCLVIPSDDLVPEKGSIKSYLGRPWKLYSRTAYLQSYIDDHINERGWAEWDKDFALDTLYYGEYANFGPGAGTAKRVDWPGYHVITDAGEAEQFTVVELIQGDSWLSSTGVGYLEGL